MIQYSENGRIPFEKLMDLYNSVGWTAYTKDLTVMEKLLPGALSYTSAWDGNRLVGLIRTVGDGCSILYIQDLLVHPDYQRQGIGQTLVTQTVAAAENIRQIFLSTENTEKTVQFYRSVGFVTMEETGAVTFIYRGDK